MKLLLPEMPITNDKSEHLELKKNIHRQKIQLTDI
nr:MAG TPA: hypothetical protein [Crassvirales sp.]DAJ75116.1 MAG TPA: hypothetical protein [Caudoviricetes sp.]